MTHTASKSPSKASWALVALPALFSAGLVQHYGVDVPYWDEWTIAPLLRQIDDRTLTLGALFAQHNEHRMFVPRIIQLVAALSVGWWDTRVGMWVSQCLLVATLGGCVTVWRRSALKRSPCRSLASLALIALILYSPSQYQNLFWGFQVCFFIPAICLLASSIVSSSRTNSIGLTLAVAAACSTVATLTMLPGLLTWPLAAAAVVLARGLPRRDDRLAWRCWAVCCACVIGVYFLHYDSPEGSPSVWSTLAAPGTLLAGVATCMGGSFAVGVQPLRVATVLGVAVIAVFVSLLIAVWRRRSDASLVIICTPWIVMGIFGILTASAITLGRVGYGYVALLESRYTSLTAWTLIGIVMISAILRERAETVAAGRMWPGLALATFALLAVAFPHHLESVRRSYNERLQSLAVYTFAEAAPRATPMLPPWVAWPPFRQELIHLERHGWRAPRPRAPTWMDNDEGPIQCEVGVVEFQVASGQHTMAGGWAYLPKLGRPADAVLVTITRGPSRRITVVQPPLIGRRDIGATFGTDDALVTGWTLDSGSAGPGESMDFWALDIRSLRAYRLCHAAGT